MTSESAAVTLHDVLSLLEGPDKVKITYEGREHAVKLIDDYGLGSRNASFFLAGFEFGPHVLVHARSFESAWEAWVDEEKPIDEDELIEAYGVVDRQEITDAYIAGHGEAPPYWKREAWDAWHEGLKLARTWWLANYKGADLDLIEGYEYQSNFTGTGIVAMGHYAWMKEVGPSDLGFAGVVEEEEEGAAG